MCLGFLLEASSTLNQIADLPKEWEAERTHLDGDWLKIVGTQLPKTATRKRPRFS
jgi:hypothetical protein